jgi:hypothetical protein
MDRVKDFFRGLIGLVLWIGLIAGVPWFIDNQTKCGTEVTPYKEVSISDPETYVDSPHKVSAGVSGKDNVCRKSDGTVTKRTVIKPAVNETTYIGTKERPVSPPVYITPQPVGGGAICSDGSRSYSTGRGTCSHHNGVAQWL